MKTNNYSQALVSGIKAYLEKNRDSLTGDEVELFENTLWYLENLDQMKPDKLHKIGEIVLGQLLKLCLNRENLDWLGDCLNNL